MVTLDALSHIAPVPWDVLCNAVGTTQFAAMPIRFEVVRTGALVHVRLWQWGIDVMTGDGLGWHQCEDYPVPRGLGRDLREQLEFLRSCMKHQALHEVDEGFVFEGDRVFDPHRRQG